MTKAERSAVMALIRSRDTKPEKVLRSALHRAGFRFRLHYRSLPGSPDLVFPGRRKVIFVHGCFWHLHKCQKESSKWPQSNREYWIPKLEANRKRDARNRAQTRRAQLAGIDDMGVRDTTHRPGRREGDSVPKRGRPSRRQLDEPQGHARPFSPSNGS